MIRKTNVFQSILMRRRRKMSFLFRHLIHRELYASLLVGGRKMLRIKLQSSQHESLPRRKLGTN